ncbi:MAG: hypothetical protein AAGD25_31415 [Cyanobacteria bacterium P01_F01_bin.150]
MRQWDFFVLSTSKLNEECGERKRISLNKLLNLSPEIVSYGNLKEAIERPGSEANKRMQPDLAKLYTLDSAADMRRYGSNRRKNAIGIFLAIQQLLPL